MYQALNIFVKQLFQVMLGLTLRNSCRMLTNQSQKN